ncbi:MAG TPA: CHAT domain-containing protein [Leptolyngbyaceae cyanobacterium]
MRRSLGFLFLLSLTLCLYLGQLLPTWQVATAVSPDASQLVQQGVDLYQVGNYKDAIAPWQTALNLYQKTKNPANATLVQENLARAYEQIGESASAVDLWDLAIAYYRKIKDISQVGRLLTEQAQSYTNLGQPRKAISLLCGNLEVKSQNSSLASRYSPLATFDCIEDSSLQIARVYKDRNVEAAALGSLGNAYRLMGEYKVAIAYLQSSLKLANEINNQIYRASSLNSLGNAYINLAKVNYRRANSAQQRGDVAEADRFRQISFQDDTKALKYFQDSLNLALSQKDSKTQLRVLLNSIPPLHRTQAVALAERTMQQALALLEEIPDSREKVYAILDLANLQLLPAVEANGFAVECAKPEKLSQVHKLNEKAISIARHLQDSRAESFANGQLGHIYECRGDYQQALNFTRQAQWSADQKLKSKDSLYLWQWQAGRIFKAQSQYSEAIKAYEQAVSTLEEIRSDLLTEDRDLQLDFRDTVLPIYRELTQLRLEQAALPSIQPAKRNKELNSALTTIESLTLAELQNYFGNDCVVSLPSTKIDLALTGTGTAIFSSIILQQRTAILVSLPNGEKKLGWIDLDSKKLRQVINEFRRGLERYRDLDYDPKQAQQLYDLIVRPFAVDLEALQIKTLVFVQDGILRSVPMSALHDGKKFLVQKYAIATTPSLALTAPKNSNSKQRKALALGLTKQATVNGRFFPALTNVEIEISQIEAQIPGSKQLLDDKFTRLRLQQELSKTLYPIIHIATHGKFGTEPEDTFLVTGNNDKLTITDLETAIRSINHNSDAVELLFLTACQTAVGDDRAALGLAGVAVSAGVRSALATLWFIQDAPTVTLVTKFYHHWHNLGASKAEALQVAQQALIAAGGQYAHPAYWAPFILIGNWL